MAIQTEAIFDSAKVQEFLSNLSSRLRDVKDGEKKYIGLLSAIVFKDVHSHFKSGQGSNGPWQRWSDGHRKQMAKRGRSESNMLQDSMRLFNNFKMTNVRTSEAGPVWFNDAKTKSGFAYAYAHNEGGTQLPKRDFMWLSDQAEEKIGVQTLQFMLDEGV